MKALRNLLWLAVTALLLFSCLNTPVSSLEAMARSGDAYLGWVRWIVIAILCLYAYNLLAKELKLRRRRNARRKVAELDQGTSNSELLRIEGFTARGGTLTTTSEVPPDTIQGIVYEDSLYPIPSEPTEARYCAALFGHNVATPEQLDKAVQDAYLVSGPTGEIVVPVRGRWIRASMDGALQESAEASGIVELTIQDEFLFLRALLAALAASVADEALERSRVPVHQTIGVDLERGVEQFLLDGDDRWGKVLIANLASKYASPPPADVPAADTQMSAVGLETIAELLKDCGVSQIAAEIPIPKEFETDPCIGCAGRDKRMAFAQFWGVAGLVTDVWEIQRRGNHCAACARRHYFTCMAMSLTLCWFGIWSLLRGTASLVTNSINLIRFYRHLGRQL